MRLPLIQGQGNDNECADQREKFRSIQFSCALILKKNLPASTTCRNFFFPMVGVIQLGRNRLVLTLRVFGCGAHLSYLHRQDGTNGRPAQSAREGSIARPFRT